MSTRPTSHPPQGPLSPPESTRGDEQRWQERWEQVQTYWARTGHLPTRAHGTAHIRSLGSWVEHQRGQFNAGTMPAQRADQLRQWGLKMRQRPRAQSRPWDGVDPWDERFYVPPPPDLAPDPAPDPTSAVQAEEVWVPPSELPPQAQWRTEQAIRCLECGTWKKALGKHLSTHDLTAETYRAAWEMKRGQPLTCGALSATRSQIVNATGGPERMRRWQPLVGPGARDVAQEVIRTEGFRGQARRAIDPAAAAGRRAAQQQRLNTARTWLTEHGHDPDRWVTDRLTKDAWSRRRVAQHLNISERQLQDWAAQLRIPERPRGPRPASQRPRGHYKAPGGDVPRVAEPRQPSPSADTTWHDRLAEVSTWRQATGAWPSSGAAGSPQEQKLGSWLKQQRHLLRRNTLPAQRADALLAAGAGANTTDDAHAAPRKRTGAATKEANARRWSAHAAAVRHYRDHHDGALPPRGEHVPPTVRALGRWVSVQRSAQRAGRLSPDQERDLDELLGERPREART